MVVFDYNGNGQRLWVGTAGWIAGPENPSRYIEFNAAPTSGNSFTVTNVAFNYGDFQTSFNFNILNFNVYCSTDNWSNRTPLAIGLAYLNTTMSSFTQNVSVPVAAGSTFSLRIYPFAVQNGIASTPTFAIHNSVVINGTTAPSLGSICGTKFNDLNGNGVQDAGEPGLPNWQIGLSIVTIPPVVTDSLGHYCFNNLPAGTYTVAEQNQTGWQQTAPPSPGTYTVTLAAGQNADKLNFGNKRELECIPPPNNMVGWWTGDNNANDISGLNNNGILHGGATYVSGKVANAFNVSGIADYISVPDNSSLNFGRNNLSIDAWVRTADSNNVLSIVQKQAGTPSNPIGYILFIVQGKLSFQLGDGSFALNHPVTNVQIADGKWHFVAVTVDRKNTAGGRLYIDGSTVLTFDPTTRSNSITNTSALIIANRQIGSITARFQDQIDEVEIFNRVLSTGEVYSIFAADSVGKCKQGTLLGSICGVKFNDVNGNGVRDAGEPGLPNWQISLNIASIPPVTTDKDGNYCFNNLPAGTYTVAETNQTGWQQTFPVFPGTYTVTLAPGQNINDQNFGNQLAPCVNGTKAWSPLGTGTNGEVWALAVIGTDLYVGGVFTSAGGNVANHIAKWNGSSWSSLGNGINNGLNGGVFTLAVIGTDLYAGGWFTSAGGSPAMNIAKWNGSNWSALGNGLPGSGAVEALAVMGNSLYAGGGFTTALGGPGDLVAKWDVTTSTWSALGSSGGMNDRVNSLVVIGTDLYAGGQFTTAGGVSAQYIGKWNGTSWSALGAGMNLRVGGGLELMGGNLYAGGVFTTAGNVPADRIAEWNVTTSAWSALGSSGGMNDEVQGFAVIGSDLYASGGFATAGGASANRVAKWDGATWSPLGTGMNDGVWRLAVIGTDLYAGGVFTTAGGLSAHYVAKWGCTSALTSVDGPNTDNALPQRFLLEQNYPNPFNPTTQIVYELPSEQLVSLRVYNSLGQQVAVLVDGQRPAGAYTVTFHATDLPSGIYFYRLIAGEFQQTHKLLLLK